MKTIRERHSRHLPCLLGLLCAPLLTASAWAQDPVKWKAEFTLSKLLPGQSGVLRVSAKIDDTWHIYAPSTPAGGPFATQIKIPPDGFLSPTGKLSYPKPIRKHDEGFGTTTEYFEKSVKFSIPAKFKLSKSKKAQIQVVFQPCSPRSCLPPETITVPLVIRIESKNAEAPPLRR